MKGTELVSADGTVNQDAVWEFVRALREAGMELERNTSPTSRDEKVRPGSREARPTRSGDNDGRRNLR
jgi:hypothetical protein